MAARNIFSNPEEYYKTVIYKVDKDDMESVEDEKEQKRILERQALLDEMDDGEEPDPIMYVKSKMPDEYEYSSEDELPEKPLPGFIEKVEEPVVVEEILPEITLEDLGPDPHAQEF